MFTKFRKEEKGFTLIELLIVVAIIGILAAIAIPQFSTYRIRGFNSAAASDLRNTKTAEESLFADWQGYGISGTEVVVTPQTFSGGTGAGAAVLGPPPVGSIFAVTMTDRNGTFQGLQIAVSSNVTLIATTEVPVAPAIAASYTVIAKHANGDTAFGTDGDTTAIYRDNTTWPVATAVASGDEPPSLPQADDFAGIGAWLAM